MPPIDTVGGWPALLGELLAGRDLTGEQAGAALATVLAGEATPAQTAALIVALRMKGETVDEVVGMTGAMLDAAAPLDLPPGTIDIVGTGGSAQRRERALNVSTMASLVAAGAGATVCKHGNVRASSTSGSMDLLRELGVGFELDGAQLAEVVRDVGIGFCFAKAFHSAMRHAGPVRAELGVPTVFNVLGPLSHPGRVRRQVVGVADPALLDLVAGVLAARNVEHTLVVHGHGALDEIALTGPTTYREIHAGEIVAEGSLEPSSLGVSVVTVADLPGGSPAENARIARDVFAGATGPARDIVCLNAAAGLYVAGVVGSVADGVPAAAAAIDDGRVDATLERLVERTTIGDG